ncbi:MAG TPA: ABC transporter permease [Firmicutes bacterium]|nr:ABC transporter permease [Bacillota bacterium]
MTISSERLQGSSGHRWERLWVSLVAVLLALLVGAVVILWAGRDPILAYRALWEASFGSWRGFGEALVSITPLIFTGLSVAFCSRTGLFNIGAEGQFIIGQMGAAIAGYMITGVPAVVHVPLALAAGALAGALWAAVPGLLKAKLGAHEVINTIMMNYIALYFTHYLVIGPLKGHSYLPVTKQVLESARLWRFLPPTRANIGFFIALATAGVVYFILWRTTLGYECRAVGLNAEAARYAGINVERNLVVSMMIGGALAGMGGAVQVLGVQHRFYDLFGFTGYGFDGIAVAMLGSNHPLGVIAGASLFGIMARGSQNMQSVAQVPQEVVGIVQAAVIIFIAADYIIRRLVGWRRSQKAGQRLVEAQ